MRKILSLGIALAVTLSLASCTTANNRINRRVGFGDNNGITTRRLSGTNDMLGTNNYRDGVYTGYGNGHRNGNERAVVQVRNGRIVDIDLTNVNQQGANNLTGNRLTTGAGGAGITPGTRIDNQTGTDIGLRNDTVTGNEFTRRNIPGTTPGTIIGNLNGRNTTGDTSGYGTGYGPGNMTGYTPGNTTGYNPGNLPSNIPNNATGYRNNYNGTYGGTMGTPVGTTLDGVRTNLENAMVAQQTYDVNVSNSDTNMTSTINNWKLAVRRALDQARR